MCARNGFIQAHGFGGRPDGRLRPVRGAIDEGDIGRYEGEPRKAVSAGIRGKELMTILFTNSDPDGTPVGNNGLAQAQLCKGASQTILWHMGREISTTGKTKVGGNANFVLIRIEVRFAG